MRSIKFDNLAQGPSPRPVRAALPAIVPPAAELTAAAAPVAQSSPVAPLAPSPHPGPRPLAPK